jgi:uncharacterized protein (UPF0261 family)
MKFTIAIIATCDTKGEEALYIKDRIRSYGLKAVVVDTGVLGDPIKVEPDYSKHEVAAAVNLTIDQVKAPGSRGAAVEKMSLGVHELIKKLHTEGKLHGLIAIGGAEGSIIARAAMDALPVGVPKIAVSSIASGDHKFKDIIGYNDAVVMHSVIDILGLNTISKQIFDTAVGAIVGMVRVPKVSIYGEAKRIGISMLGTTTKPILNVIKPKLEELGYEVFTFHANGVGGACMEDLAREGYFTGIVDFSPNELVANLFGGLHVSRPERLEVLMELGLPTIVAPGALSLIVLSKEEALESKYNGRQKYYHNPRITLARASRDEMKIIGRALAEKMNKAKGKVKFLYPTEGFSSQDKVGLSLYDPEGNLIFLEELKKHLRKNIPLIEISAHINDDRFAAVAFEQLLEVMGVGDAEKKS